MAETFLRGVESLKPGDHACLVYDSDERRDGALASFLGQGLRCGERVLYLARDAGDPLARALAEQASPNQFATILSDDCYLRGGRFDPLLALEGFRSALAEAAELGFGIVRTAGGPPTALTANGASALLPRYERNAGTLFHDGRLLSVCTYDVRRVPPVSLLGIVDAHPVVLYALGGDGRLEVRATGDAELAPAGWLDLTTLGALTAPLARAIASGEDVSLDLRDVQFVDVAALRLLAEAARELAARGRRLEISNAPAPVPAMLRLLGYEGQEGLVLR